MTVPNVPFYLSQANTEFSGNNYASGILLKAAINAPVLVSTLGGKSSATHTAVFGLYGGRPYANGAYAYSTVGSISPHGLGGHIIDYFDTTTNELVLAVQSFLTPGSLRCTATIEGLGTGSAMCDSLSWTIPIPGIDAFLRARIGSTIKLKLVLG